MLNFNLRLCKLVGDIVININNIFYEFSSLFFI
jgi:hypothetical protein